ncbi:flagellar assembly protein FliH [Cytobacillus sp. Hz8]|uniref:flagellar assembly protein FliH n=1 Tax=Cytobacillus sp. Hz8 TaxID=3347168 RepID=UPI0035E197B0
MSRLIKSGWTPPNAEGKKIISIKMLDHFFQEDHEVSSFHSEIEYQRIMEQANLEAETLIQKTNLEAEAILNQVNQEKQSWEQEKQILTNQAQEQGFNSGLEQGRIEAHNEYLEQLHLAKSVVDSSKEDYLNKIESSERTILDLGIKVAEKILGLRLGTRPEDFISIVRLAIKEARDYREVQIHVNPIHYDLLLSQKEDLISIFPKETDLYLYPDDDLPKDSCIIESANGRIDASIDSQLEEIKHKLIELLESEDS